MSKQKSKSAKKKNLSDASGSNIENAGNNTIVGKLDAFFGRNLHIVFFISLILTIILGIYLFDVKIDEGGDDSDYILSAKKFLEGRSFPTWHGAFYPIFLSLPMLIFGVNVVVFKVLSLLCIIAHQVFFF